MVQEHRYYDSVFSQSFLTQNPPGSGRGQRPSSSRHMEVKLPEGNSSVYLLHRAGDYINGHLSEGDNLYNLNNSVQI